MTAQGPVSDLATFAEMLRGRGLTVTPEQVADMARAMTLVDAAQRSQVEAALASLSVTDPSHIGPFREEFERFFASRRQPGEAAEQQSQLATSTAVKPILQQLTPPTEVSDTNTQSGASLTENISTRDFADLDEDQLAEARKLVLAMAWEPSDFKTRRWRHASSGPQPDLRRTLKRMVRPEGDLMPMVRRIRQRKQRPLILIADISGSMEKYAELFLVFAHAAQRRLETVEVFTFSTELTRITEDLKRRDTITALNRVAASVDDWSGGTKIGAALAEWNRSWSRRMARGGPVAMILSDGWDCGDPGLLEVEIARLARSVHSVLWLNPLAARADYRPATRGMRTVLPYVDHLLPAASVMDLRGVVRLLDSMAVG